MTATPAAQPPDASAILAVWDSVVERALAWLERTWCDNTGLGFTPSERLQKNAEWRNERRNGGRLERLVALASQAEAVCGYSPTAQLLAVLRGRDMPDVATLTVTAKAVATALEQMVRAGRQSTGEHPPARGATADPNTTLVPATVADFPANLETDAKGAQRSRLDEHVERAFDLLRHYQQFICDPRGERTDGDHVRALDQLEQVLRRWLPLAHAADDPVINGVAAVVGDRGAAANLLRDADLWRIRNDRLQSMAKAAFVMQLTPSDAIAACRRELQHWRALLPHIWRRPDGTACVDESARKRARLHGGYWSMDVESRPSFLGASYFLACACDAIAVAAAGMKVSVEVIRPAIHLALALRAHPQWASIEPADDVRVLDEQLTLATKVDQLIAEMVVLLNANGTPKQGVPNDANQLDFTGTSEGAVTEVMRAVSALRTASSSTRPNKKQIQAKAGRPGGAGDRAIKYAVRVGLLTPDYRVTDFGRLFLEQRS